MVIDTESSQSATLPYSKEKQGALFGHMLLNDRFFVQISPRVESSWWADPFIAKAYAAKDSFHNKYKRPPSIPELLNCIDIVAEEEPVRKRIVSAVEAALYSTKNFGLDALQSELTQWLKAQIFKVAAKKATTLYNDKKPDEAYIVMETMSNDLKTASFNDDPKVDWSDYTNQFEEQEAEYKDALTWGVDLFDQKLTPAAQKGSLLRGDTTVIIAPTNIGKTTCCATIIRHNILRMKPILFLVHEGTISDIRTKVWCSVLRITRAELLAMYKTDAGRQKMDKVLPFLMKYLDFVHLPRAGMTIEKTVSIVRRMQEERVAKNEGNGYSMLVDDYPACLTTDLASKGNMAPRHIHSYVYDQFVDLGLEYNFHCLLPIQTNREGSKVNGGKEDRLITKEDVHEAFGPMQRATNIISINRDPAAQQADRITYFIDKSRSNETGWAIVCKSDFSRSITHSNRLGATCYRGTSTMSERLDELLLQFGTAQQAIPEHLYIA